MRSILVFLSLVTLSQAGIRSPRALSGRIIDGQDVAMGEIPYQVSLRTRSNYHFCGGSILNKNYVITGAHCVQKRTVKEISVIAGTIHLNDPKSTHPAIDIIIHADYNPSDSWINDIALIKVAKDFVISETISYVPLPDANEIIPVKSIAVLSGWGDTVEGGKTPNTLQRTEIQIADQVNCSKMYSRIKYKIYDTQICAYNPDIRTGSCDGDSGGPLTVDGKLVGVVSFANGCGSRKYPTIFTRISVYIDWINAHMI